MTTEPGLFVGKESMTFEHEGSPVFIGPTIVVRAGHPVMQGREDLFTPLVVHYDVQPPDDEPPVDAPKTPTKAARAAK